MVMIRSGNRNSINVFVLFVKQLAEIFIIFCFWKRGNRLCRPAIIDVAQISNLGLAALSKVGNITFAFSTCANTCDIQFITWSFKANTAKYKAWDNSKGSRNASLLNKFSSGKTVLRIPFSMGHNLSVD